MKTMLAWLAVSVAIAGPATAYPDKPIGTILPWSPGGAADTNVRSFTEAMSGILGVPIAVRNQQQFGLPIPNAPILIGWDWVGQLAVLPDPGVSAPPISLPPGRLFEVR